MLLNRYNINPEQVFVFVGGDEQDLVDYRNAAENNIRSIFSTRITFIQAPVGLANARNLIYDTFTKGTPLVMLDDDLLGFLHKDKIPIDFAQECQKGFDECVKAGCSLWGFYPVASTLFMKNRVNTGHLFIYGCVFGIINPNSEYRDIFDFKEDWYRSLDFCEKEGKTLRLEYIAPKQTFRKQKGGLANTRSIESEEEGCRRILELFPELVARKKVKGPWPELRMKKSP